MAAAARYGSFTGIGLESGRAYSIDVYISDVANALVNWDSGNGAGTASSTFWIAPENVQLVGFSVASGLTDTTNIALTVDGSQVPGGRMRYANFVNTLATRQPLAIGIYRGSQVGAIQIA